MEKYPLVQVYSSTRLGDFVRMRKASPKVLTEQEIELGVKILQCGRATLPDAFDLNCYPVAAECEEKTHCRI
jgi:hypothetical protein